MFFGSSAVTSIMVIRKGGTAKLSTAQIAMLVTDMALARKKLSKDKYREVKKIYQEYMKDSKSVPMDYEGFLERAVAIAREFEKVTPFVEICDREAEEYRPILERLGE